MSFFQTMDRDVLLKLLEGSEDTLTEPLQKKLDGIKNMRCPSCNSAMAPVPDVNNPFDNSDIPRYLASCTQCDCLVEPDTLKVVEAPIIRDAPE